jgi:hypothetical protein
VHGLIDNPVHIYTDRLVYQALALEPHFSPLSPISLFTSSVFVAGFS